MTDIFLRLLPHRFLRVSGRQLGAWLQSGYRYQREGKRELAQTQYERVLQSAPDNVDANYLLGSLLGEKGELGTAALHLERAIAGNPDFSDAYAALGNVRLLQADKATALACYERAVQLDKNNTIAHSNLGLLYQVNGKHAAALREFQLAYRLAPGLPDILKNLTLAYIELGQYDEALAFLDPILRARPQQADALKCKGFVLQKMHKPDLALGYYQQAREMSGSDPELLNNLGIVLQDLGRLDQAIECYDTAISLQPDFPLAIWHRSVAYLLRHDFVRGWPDYELRSISADRPPMPQHCPQWDGGSLAGRGILVLSEQGLGDEIMFASCLPDLIASSQHCAIECSPKLETLFRRSFPAARVYATTASRDLPPGLKNGGLEVQTLMGSVPQFLRRTQEEFPQHGGYLQADPQRTSFWRERLAQQGPGLKIGISWQGGTRKTRSQIRSLPLLQWLPVLRVPGAHFVNLQYTDCSAELAELRAATGIEISDWREVRDDYEHAAALVSALDLVISVCTAVIHLGGALGRPVWVMAPYSPEWRYGIRGEKMPWYPSVRVLRQPGYGLWGPLVEQIARELLTTSNQYHGR